MTEKEMRLAGRDLYLAMHVHERNRVGWKLLEADLGDLERYLNDGDFDAELLPITKTYVERLGAAWGLSVDQIFDQMQLINNRADALYYILMGCHGRDIRLKDHLGVNIHAYRENTGQILDTVPMHADLSEFRVLAQKDISESLETPDNNPDPSDQFQPGDRVKVNTSMPTATRTDVEGLAVVIKRLDEDTIVVRMYNDCIPYQFGRKAIVVPNEDARVVRRKKT